jgi:hypothetical protein
MMIALQKSLLGEFLARANVTQRILFCFSEPRELGTTLLLQIE